MNLVSWNVNGIRSVLKKGFLDFVREAAPDVLCLQETRATPEQVQLDLPGYRQYWNPAERKGYSGTATFTRVDALGARYGIGDPLHDGEGRVLTLEFPDFFLVNVYTPNSQRELTRLEYRQAWDLAFLGFLKRLERGKPVVFCGDLNVAHTELDLANPKANVRNHGFTPEERAGMTRIAQAGFVDAFRLFTAGNGHYTWWSPMAKARERNIGWRIDAFWVSEALRPRVKRAAILPAVMGSDHCPVALELAGA
jgi:exodeoxyribonuclease-3